MVDKIKNTNTNINNIKIVVPTTKPRRQYTTTRAKGEPSAASAEKALTTLYNRSFSSGPQPNISVGGPTIMFPSQSQPPSPVGVAPPAPVGLAPPVRAPIPIPPVGPRPSFAPKRIENPPPGYGSTPFFGSTPPRQPNLIDLSRDELRPDQEENEMFIKQEEPLYDIRRPEIREAQLVLRSSEFDTEKEPYNPNRPYRNNLHPNNQQEEEEIYQSRNRQFAAELSQAKKELKELTQRQGGSRNIARESPSTRLVAENIPSPQRASNLLQLVENNRIQSPVSISDAVSRGDLVLNEVSSTRKGRGPAKTAEERQLESAKQQEKDRRQADRLAAGLKPLGRRPNNPGGGPKQGGGGLRQFGNEN